MTIKAIETLRFASGDEELRAALYDEFGDDLFADFAIAAALEKRLADWGNDEDEADDEEGGAARGSADEIGKRRAFSPRPASFSVSHVVTAS